MQRGPGKLSTSFVNEKIRSVAGGNAIVIDGMATPQSSIPLHPSAGILRI